jgi:small subunit ribosomal protein S1
MPREEAEEAATEAEVGAEAAAQSPGEAAQPAVEASAVETPAEEPTPEAPAEAVAEDTAAEQAAAAAPETEAKADTEATAEGGETPKADPAEPQTGKTAEGEDVAEDDPRVQELLAAMKTGSSIDGKVFGWNQGGFHVLINGILAFCPRSEIDLGNPKSPKKYVEKTYPFRVIDHRPQGNRFTVSRKGLLEERQAKDQAATREKLAVGVEMEGRVTSLTGFGAFVDLGGGIEGMVHVSELSHLSVNHPKEVVKPGQKVKVRVLKIENDGNRISLSKKVLEANPWTTFAEKYPRGKEFTGKVTSKTDFGLFVEVEPGMEGLVHVSALPAGQTLESDEYQPGAELSGWIKDVEIKRQRISLSLKEVPTSDPWKDIAQRFNEGDTVQGTVEEVAPFGVFINLEPGLTGLLPNSEMNLPRGTQPARAYAPGTEVELQIGRIEAKRKRLTLVPEGSKIEGSRTDYKDYVKKANEESASGLGAMAAAFAKLKGDDD